MGAVVGPDGAVVLNRRPNCALCGHPTVPDAVKHNPVAWVRWVPVEEVVANDWNPNSVAPRELALLRISILADGWTQPIVTTRDPERALYVVVDGFHRWLEAYRDPEIRERNAGLCPIVVCDLPMAERMAATIRHNRARGKHSVLGMAAVIFGLLDGGWTDEEVMTQLGMENDELVRLKYVTGFAKLYESAPYRRSWETRRMIRFRHQYAAQEAHDGD